MFTLNRFSNCYFYRNIYRSIHYCCQQYILLKIFLVCLFAAITSYVIQYLYTCFTRTCLRILHISFYVLRQEFTSSRHSSSNCCLCPNPQGPAQFVLNSSCSSCTSSSNKRPINSNFFSNTRLFSNSPPNILTFQTY